MAFEFVFSSWVKFYNKSDSENCDRKAMQRRCEGDAKSPNIIDNYTPTAYFVGFYYTSTSKAVNSGIAI